MKIFLGTEQTTKLIRGVWWELTRKRLRWKWKKDNDHEFSTKETTVGRKLLPEDKQGKK